MIGSAMFCIHTLSFLDACFFRLLHSGGTIKHCEQRALAHNHTILANMRRAGVLDARALMRLLEGAERDIRALNASI